MMKEKQGSRLTLDSAPGTAILVTARGSNCVQRGALNKSIEASLRTSHPPLIAIEWGVAA